MRKLLCALLLVLFVGILSCKKADAPPPVPPPVPAPTTPETPKTE